MSWINYLIIYLIIINLFGFLLMGIDKKRAIKHQWRIKEKTLFLMAIIGGSVGSIIGMLTFHHKTKHKSFMMGMPLIMIVQILLICYFVFYI